MTYETVPVADVTGMLRGAASPWRRAAGRPRLGARPPPTQLAPERENFLLHNNLVSVAGMLLEPSALLHALHTRVCQCVGVCFGLEMETNLPVSNCKRLQLA